MSLNNWLEKNNVSDDGFIYIVTGGNTFEIKDDLKGAGARYHKELGWFFTKSTLPEVTGYKLPEGFELREYCARDILVNNPYGQPYVYDNYVDEIKALHKVKTEKEVNHDFDNSEYLPEPIGTRLRKIPAILKSVKAVSSQWGNSFLYTFDYNGNQLIWFTQSENCAFVDPDTEITLSATIKDFKEYNGIKQTVLSRCIVKEREC